jgi:hypothetical protein
VIQPVAIATRSALVEAVDWATINSEPALPS